MRINDLSSYVCSSDLAAAFRVTVTFAFDDEDWRVDAGRMTAKATLGEKFAQLFLLDEIQLILGRRENLRRYRPRGLIRLRFAACREIGRASCRERVCQYV